jgi:hypothetical protein
MVDMLAPMAPGHRARSFTRVGETFRLCHTIVAGRKL